MGNYAGFSKVQLRKPERSKFDLGHQKKVTGRMGKLIPIFYSRTLPNDTFRVKSEVLLRLAPLLAPIYHRVRLYVHFFFIPMRLLYKDWELFITNGRLGTETLPVPPWIQLGEADGGDDSFDVSSLSDYLRGPVFPSADLGVWGAKLLSPIPFAAYYKVWYDYYRDRNYVEDNDILPLPSGDVGAITGITDIFKLKTRAWRHDIFNSALPWTQRGDEVLLPVELSGYAPVVGRASDGSIDRWNVAATITPGGGAVTLELDSDPDAPVGAAGVNDFGYADLAASENGGYSTTINEFRQALALQSWLERNAVAGSRYNESIMAHFNRHTSDGRLQRAEYLGGGLIDVQISEVMTTSWSKDGSDNDVPPANMTGRGATYSQQNGFTYNCEEHGVVMGILSVLPEPGYVGGIAREMIPAAQESFLDYPWPSFAHLGEQEVYKYEIWGDSTMVPTNGNPDNTPMPRFGYQSRYSDWKYIPSTAHGDFRTNLDFWHLDQKFAAEPVLGQSFVEFPDALQDRIFAVSGVDTLWMYINNDVSVVRSLPYFGTPRLVG